MRQSLQVMVSGVEICLFVRKSKRATRGRIRALLDGMEVVVPWRSPSRFVDEIVNSNRDWILANHLRLISMRSESTGRVRYLGVEYGVILGGTRPTFDLESRQAYTGPKGVEALRSLMIREARKRISTEVEFWKAKMVVSPARLSIRDQRSRWGSCGTNRNLSFNWRLIMAPPEVMESVVIHELAHLVHHNHSREFWDLVKQHCPRHKEHERWLDEHASLLMLSLKE